jgi:hypothetical protein
MFVKKVYVATSELYEEEKEDIKQEQALALAAFIGSSVQHKQSSPDYRPGLPIFPPISPPTYLISEIASLKIIHISN